MSSVRTFQDLKIWQKGRELSILIFQLSEKGNFAKDFPLKNQIRSSSGSVMDNIAEGFERNSRLEFVQFLSIAKGSCGETRSQIIRASDYEYITQDEANDVMNRTIELGRMIGNLISYLNKSEVKGMKFKNRN